MKKIFTTPEVFRTGPVISMLEAAGITYMVRNQFLSGAIGELPPTECWPEIWITDDSDLERAMAIVREATMEPGDKGPWQCDCGEKNEGTFGSCWKCGADRPGMSEE